MDYDFAAMRRDGYSDAQILDALDRAGQLSFDLKAVRADGYGDSAILRSMAGDQRAAPAAEPEPSSILRRAGDLGISALKGVISVPEALVGLADIPTGGAAGRAAEALGVKFAESKELLSDLYSPEQKAANRAVAEAQGFTDTAGAMLANPSTIAQTAVESLPQMGLGGAVGRGVLAVAPRLGALGAAAIGEGAVGAGTAAEQIRQQSGGDLSLGQAGAALASGIGTGAFGLVGGRLAQKLGIADIDTALVQAGAPAGSTKGVIRRMLEGGVSEGVFEELPQSIQEQMWQNAAMDRPLLEGVPESAAQGLIVGGLFGGVAGGALNGSAPAPAADVPPAVDPATGEPLQLGYDPDVARRNNNPFISFPDGSVGRKEDAEAFIASLPEAERVAARARLFGYGEQPAPAPTADDVLAAGSVDDAIAVAQQAITSDTPAMLAERNAQIDAAWQQHLRQRAETMQAEFAAAEQQRRDADVLAMQNQLGEQQVEQAAALTRAQGFDDPAPTAMQLAMQAAQAKRQAAIDGATAAPAPAAEPAMVEPAPPAEVATAAADPVAQAPAASQPDTLEQAKQILTAAGVTGNERMAALRAIRTGENTLDDLIDAHPPKEATNATAPTAPPALRDRPDAGAAAPAPVQPSAAGARPDPAQLDEGAAGDAGPVPTGTGGLPAGTGVPDGDAARGAAGAAGLTSAAPLNERVAQRQATIASLAERSTKELRALAKSDKRAYVRNAIADIIAERDGATRAKRSEAAKRALVKAKQIDPDNDTMAEAIAHMGGIRRDSAQGRMRFAPEEVAVRAGIRPLFPVNGGMRIEDMGAALAELGYVQRDENGKYDQADFEEKLAEVAGGGDVRTPQGMMLRAQQEYEAAQQQAGAESADEFALVEYYADNADDDLQRIVDAAFDAPQTNKEYTDEEIDAAFGIAPAEGRAVPEVDTEAPAREGNRGDQAPAGQPRVIDEESYLAANGAGRGDIGEAGMHKRNSRQTDKQWKRIVESQSEKDSTVVARREELREEYNERVKAGEIRPPSEKEKIIATANGHPDNQSVQAARRIAEKRGWDWRGGSNGSDFDLTSETPDEVRTRVTEQEEATRRASAEQRAQDDAARRDRERRDIAARQDASAENFQLGQSADDSLSGQQAMFSTAPRDESPQALADVRAAWNAAGIKNFISERNGIINLSQIVVPKEARSSGAGTRAMQQLIDYADLTGQVITLTPSADFGGTKSRLVDFYKRFGFVENKGRNKDYEISEAMYRPATEARASTSAAPAGGITAAEVTKAIAPLRAKWANFTRVNVVQSAADLPATVTDHVQVDGFSEGFYDPRTDAVYLIADNIESAERAAWVAAHEVIGHGGLRMLNDKAVTQAVQQAGANKFIRDLAQAIRLDRGMSSTPEHIALEEAIAELSAATETGDFDALADRYGVTVPDSARGGIRGVVARVVAAVRQFLATITRQPVESFSDADVRNLIAQQRAAVEGNQFTDVSKMVDDGVRASERRRSIEVDGVRRSIENSKGQVIVQDFNKQMAFYRWFGDSAVVDDKGRPLVVYHGTPSGGFSSFDAERTGSNTGAAGGDHGLGGFYFTPDPNIADAYSRSADVAMVNEYEQIFGEPPKAIKMPDGSSIYPVYLAIQNPYVVERGPITEKMVDEAKAAGHDGIVSGRDGSYPEFVTFRANQIKSATGNAGTFNPDDADIRASRAPSSTQTPAGEERIPDWAAGLTPEQQAALRKSGAIYTEKTMRQKVKELTDGALKKMQYGILDQFAPIKEQLGRMPYIMARMAKNADGTLEAMMLYGRPYLDADGGMLVDTTKKGFIETMQALDGEHDRFFSWLAGKRAAQLKKEGRENLFTDTDISALATLNQGTMKDGSSREAAYLRAQKDVAEMNKAVLDIAETSGLIDGESRKLWQSDYYVPFYRVMEEGVAGPSIKSGLVNQKSIQKLKGGTNNLGDLTQNMLMNWSTLLTASAKNRAAKASLEVAAGMGVATEAPESTLRAMAKSAKTRAVSYMEEGENRWFIVEDEHLLAAISALEFNGYNNGAMRAMSWFKNTLTKAITVSPYFKVRNLIRDSLSVLAVSDINRNPLANLKNGFSLLRNDEVRAQLVAGGGIYRFGMTMEGNRAENVKRLIDDGVADDTILNTAEKMAKFTRKLWRAYEEAGDLTENVNRAALYQQLRAEGKSHLEASFEARDLMDFGLSGAWAGVRALNQILPFFNARLQGLYKLGRGYNDDPKRMGYVIGALAMVSLALGMAYKDDEDWKKRSDSDRNNYWWFKVGGTAYRIPKPFEIGAAATAIEHFAALFYDSENTNIDRFTMQMGELVNGQLAMNPIPQVFRPLIDVYSNKDAFTGRPIESQAMQRLRPEDRYTHNTSELARLLSKSGVLVDPVSLVAGTGVKQLSPVQIDSLIKGYFAGVGVMAVAGADGLLHHTLIDRGAALPVPLRTLTGSFMEELPTNSSRYVDMLYKTAQDVEQTYASYQNAIKQGNIEEARRIQKDEGDTLAKYHMIESLKKNEARITQVIQRTINDKVMTGEQKAEQIRRLKVIQDQIARQMVTGK